MHCDDVSSDDDIVKEKVNNKNELDSEIPTSMGFGRNVKGKEFPVWNNQIRMKLKFIELLFVVENWYKNTFI